MGMYVARSIYGCSVFGRNYPPGSNLGEPFQAKNYKFACKTAKKLCGNVPMRVEKIRELEDGVKKDR